MDMKLPFQRHQFQVRSSRSCGPSRGSAQERGTVTNLLRVHLATIGGEDDLMAVGVPPVLDYETGNRFSNDLFGCVSDTHRASQRSTGFHDNAESPQFDSLKKARHRKYLRLVEGTAGFSTRSGLPGFPALQHRPSGPLRAPARRISRRGFVTEIGRESPLRKMTSAADAVGRDSAADALAEGCPVRHSSQRPRYWKVCPVKKA